jgi:hypothetical protein
MLRIIRFFICITNLRYHGCDGLPVSQQGLFFNILPVNGRHYWLAGISTKVRITKDYLSGVRYICFSPRPV